MVSGVLNECTKRKLQKTSVPKETETAWLFMTLPYKSYSYISTILLAKSVVSLPDSRGESIDPTSQREDCQRFIGMFLNHCTLFSS